jgi:hypothetical protein
MGGVGNAETSHAVSVSPLRKVPLECLGASVHIVAADLAVVADVQSVQLVQPVGDGLQYKM